MSLKAAQWVTLRHNKDSNLDLIQESTIEKIAISIEFAMKIRLLRKRAFVVSKISVVNINFYCVVKKKDIFSWYSLIR